MNNKQRKTKYQEKYKKNFPYNWFRYCIDPLENIRGWDEMLNDTSGQPWHLHHRDEIPCDDVVVSKGELKDRGLYYNLPASKLAFMTESEHLSLHQRGENNTMYGKSGELAPGYGRNKYGITKESLHELYVVQGLTQVEIAEKFRCRQPRISRKLKKFGIKRSN